MALAFNGKREDSKVRTAAAPSVATQRHPQENFPPSIFRLNKTLSCSRCVGLLRALAFNGKREDSKVRRAAAPSVATERHRQENFPTSLFRFNETLSSPRCVGASRALAF